jgi:hypothetical protein
MLLTLWGLWKQIDYTWGKKAEFFYMIWFFTCFHSFEWLKKKGWKYGFQIVCNEPWISKQWFLRGLKKNDLWLQMWENDFQGSA